MKLVINTKVLLVNETGWDLQHQYEATSILFHVATIAIGGYIHFSFSANNLRKFVILPPIFNDARRRI